MRLASTALALMPLLAAPAFAQTEFLYDCGRDMGFIVTTYLETGTGRFDGTFSADLTLNSDGVWVNEAEELQFWPDGVEDAEPTLFIGVEQFSCSPFADDPGMNAGAEPGQGALTNTADLEMVPYGSTRGWDVLAYVSGPDFIGCGASIGQGPGFLILQRKTYGWELRIPADQTEGFEGGIITVDGRKMDAQFGFTPEGAGEAGLDESLVRAIANGSRLTTLINGSQPVSWSLAGSAAAVGKVNECFVQEGILP